jgi:chromosome segregation ATPase
MTKAKHEALRRDIEDYKLLLIKYQTLRIEQEILVSDLERQAKLLESKNNNLSEIRKKVEYLESELNTLKEKIEKQSVAMVEKEKLYNDLKKMYYKEKGKNVKMQKQQAEVYIWKGAAIFFFFAMLLLAET